MPTSQKTHLHNQVMSYLHGEKPNYEPFLLALLQREQEIFEEMAGRDNDFQRGARAERTWQLLFEELAEMLTPIQIEQMVFRLEKDVKATCELFNELSQSQKLLVPDEGAHD